MARPDFPFSAVIFDMDGVIVDTEAYYKEELRRYAGHLGISGTVGEDELNSQVGMSHQDFCVLMADWQARGGGGMGEGGALAASDAWAARRPCDYRALLNPGVPETLDELHRRGVRVALASSSPLDNIREVLAACGIARAFDPVVSGEAFTKSKPDPEIYLHTVAELGLTPAECCCVEDSVPGIAAGRAAGLTVFAKREERFGFSQDAADCIIGSVPDLLTAAYALSR